MHRVPNAQGKQGKWFKKFHVREFGNYAKQHRENREFGLFKLEILKLKDISIFATKIPKLFLKLDMSTK